MTSEYTGPSLTRRQMTEVDRLMVEVYRIELLQMMENAGRGLACLARERFLERNPEGKCVTVLSGSGGNGGGALVSARNLANWGAEVHLVLTKLPSAFRGVPKHQLDIAIRMGIPVHDVGDLPDLGEADLIIDGLIGYGLIGAPRGAARALIVWANAQDAPTLSLDTPSGLDVTTGVPYDPAITADATMTLALPKTGLLLEAATPYVGELFLADIGVPPLLYEAIGISVNGSTLFGRESTFRVR